MKSKLKFSYHLACLFFVSLCCSMCRSPSLTQSYKKIGHNYEFYTEVENNCEVTIYHTPGNADEKLNGWLQFKTKYNKTTTYAHFLAGKLHGEISVYKKRKLLDITQYEHGIKHGQSVNYSDALDDMKTIANFSKGIKSGIQEEYIDGRLYAKSTYTNGIKEGAEYFFDEKRDTINVIHYTFKDKTTSPVDLKTLEKSYLMDFQFKGIIKIESESYIENQLPVILLDIVSIDLNCNSKHFYMIETTFSKQLVFFNKLGMAYSHEIE